ncbi:ATP-binding protein [Burkholderia sp. BCC1998]|uniref:ATP-binding protein n=1 Tax=Burkholderia sp. BCC1998 TaxID=2817447 RepID=UPI002AB6342B|nr:ATP-binding protein [Burkholderia sp. BCC1998]
MQFSSRSPLWRWVSIRVIALALGAAIAVAFCMWLRFFIWNASVMRGMAEPDRREFIHLRTDPNPDPEKLVYLIYRYYGLDYVYPEIANDDWITLGALLLAAAPLIAVSGWWISRSATRQFQYVATSARQVAQGDFSTRADVVQSAPDELRGLALDFNEMTHRLQRYEQEIQASSAVLAHELRTPLNAAMGRLQGVIDGVFPPEPEQLQMVMHRLGLLNQLVDGLHLLSLARAGHLGLERACFLVEDLITERLSWVTARLDSRAIRVYREIERNLPVCADRNRLGQVFSILIENAVRYAYEGGALDIYAISRNGWLTIDFADRGPGVEPGDLERMFDRFWRAETSRARDSGGSGLGLSIALAICSAHNGSLSAIRRDGGGTVMRIRLPAD